MITSNQGQIPLALVCYGEADSTYHQAKPYNCFDLLFADLLALESVSRPVVFPSFGHGAFARYDFDSSRHQWPDFGPLRPALDPFAGLDAPGSNHLDCDGCAFDVQFARCSC